MRNFGLILEGGGMRGAFTSGVLDFWMEKELDFDDIYAVSAGACQACSYLCRQPGRGLRVWADYVRDPRFCSVRSLTRWTTRPSTAETRISRWLSPTFGPAGRNTCASGTCSGTLPRSAPPHRCR